jgi:hypothetical protein
MELERPEAGAAVFLSGQSLSLCFAICARIAGPLEREGLVAGLARLGKRHPLLAVRAIARADGSGYFTDEGTPPVPLRVVDRVNDDDWVGEAEREIQRKSAYLTGPMLRAIWIRGGDSSDLILVFDHLVADGRSAIFALRDLMALLADRALEMAPLLAPPVHELVPPDVVDRLRAAAAADRGTTAPGHPASVPKAVGPVCVEPFHLTAAETSALVRRCKLEGVTVQAALCAAFLTPFAEAQPARPMRHAEVPVDLRPRLTRPVGDSFGNMIGLAIIGADCAPGRNRWDVSRDASTALKAMSDEEIFATPPVMIALIGHMPRRPWEIDYDLSISNLGRLDIPEEYGALRLMSVYAPIFPATGADHRILGVSTFAGQMRFTFSSRGSEGGPLAERGLELLRGMAR